MRVGSRRLAPISRGSRITIGARCGSVGSGSCFQQFELLEHLGVRDNVLLPYRLHPALRLDREVVARAEELATRIGLGGLLDRSVERLSQGERQRVATCRALVTRPSLVLADEPTGNLDPANKAGVLDLLLEFAAASGATVVTVTHDRGVVDRFDRVVDVDAFHATGRPGEERA